MLYSIDQEEKLRPIAEQLGEKCREGQILAFYGDIGAGKTTLIQYICQYLGVLDKVTSPTFSLVNEYFAPKPPSSQGNRIYHMDLYRLKSVEEALNIGIEEYLNSNNCCLIEWPELIEMLLPISTIRIKIEILENSSRKILIL